MLNSKKKIITLIIIIIDILALALFISLNSFIKQKDLNTDNIENIYIFRNNKYIVPEGLKYSDYSENQFKIEANDWYALVKIYYDSDKKIYNNKLQFIDKIKKIEKNVIKDYTISINNMDIISFNLADPNSILCYLSFNDTFDYEIRIFNKDNSYQNKMLNDIIPSLLLPMPILDSNDRKSYDYEVINL